LSEPGPNTSLAKVRSLPPCSRLALALQPYTGYG
jgi:hypothetical protein